MQKHPEPGGFKKITVNKKTRYCSVCMIDNDKKQKMEYIHRLVIQTFGVIPSDLQDIKRLTVDHIDSNKSNNNISNLQWMTLQENQEKHWMNKLKEKLL